MTGMGTRQLRRVEVLDPPDSSFRCGSAPHGWGFCPVLWAFVFLATALASSEASDYVFVVDTSGSMGERISTRDPRLKIEAVQNALQTY